MTVEKWDIFDSNGVRTGRTATRGRAVFKSGEYHLVVHIWVISSNGRFLLQRRAVDKRLMPGEWAATGGAAIAGESSYEAAHRELKEELGIDAERSSLIKLTRIRRKNSLVDVWMTFCDEKAENLHLQKSEVAEARWVTKSEFEEMISSGEYHNYGEEYFDRVFEKIDDYRGAYL